MMEDITIASAVLSASGIIIASIIRFGGLVVGNNNRDRKVDETYVRKELCNLLHTGLEASLSDFKKDIKELSMQVNAVHKRIDQLMAALKGGQDS